MDEKDIVERLEHVNHHGVFPTPTTHAVVTDAAAEITRLRAEVEEQDLRINQLLVEGQFTEAKLAEAVEGLTELHQVYHAANVAHGVDPEQSAALQKSRALIKRLQSEAASLKPVERETLLYLRGGLLGLINLEDTSSVVAELADNWIRKIDGALAAGEKWEGPAYEYGVTWGPALTPAKPVDREETEAEAVLRSLASYVGAGGYNAERVDADVFERKIRWGINHLHNVTVQRCADAVEEQSKNYAKASYGDCRRAVLALKVPEDAALSPAKPVEQAAQSSLPVTASDEVERLITPEVEDAAQEEAAAFGLYTHETLDILRAAFRAALKEGASR